MKLLQHDLIAVVRLRDDDGVEHTVRFKKDQDGNTSVHGVAPSHATKYAKPVANALFGMAMERNPGRWNRKE